MVRSDDARQRERGTHAAKGCATDGGVAARILLQLEICFMQFLHVRRSFAGEGRFIDASLKGRRDFSDIMEQRGNICSLGQQSRQNVFKTGCKFGCNGSRNTAMFFNAAAGGTCGGTLPGFCQTAFQGQCLPGRRGQVGRCGDFHALTLTQCGDVVKRGVLSFCELISCAARTPNLLLRGLVLLKRRCLVSEYLTGSVPKGRKRFLVQGTCGRSLHSLPSRLFSSRLSLIPPPWGARFRERGGAFLCGMERNRIVWRNAA